MDMNEGFSEASERRRSSTPRGKCGRACARPNLEARAAAQSSPRRAATSERTAGSTRFFTVLTVVDVDSVSGPARGDDRRAGWVGRGGAFSDARAKERREGRRRRRGANARGGE
eukprot:30146-Pelagococcus_subviridis.AAC.1